MSSERSYLDGVPLRLSSKFCPIPRMHFKEIDIHIPIDALQEDYDFSLERCAIAEAKAWEEAQALRAEKESQEKLEREKEEFERLAECVLKSDLETSEVVNSDDALEHCSSDITTEENKRKTQMVSDETQPAPTSVPTVQSNVSSSHSSESVLTEDALNLPSTVETSVTLQPSVFGSGANAVSSVALEYMQTYRQDVAGAILQPQPQGLNNDYELRTSYGRFNNKDSDRSYYSHYPTSKLNLNLSDFESDTANPFDNVELKSINDMEVLATVLKNNSVTVPTSVPQNQDSSRTVNMNYMNGVGSVGFSSEQTHLHYYPPSSYPNQNFPNPNQWTPTQYYNPNVPSANSSPSVDIPTQPISNSLETPVITQPQPSSHSNPPVSVNSFTRFYFPLLTSMANSRANRDRNNSPYGVLPVSQEFGSSVGQISGMAPTLSTVSPIMNQNPNSTPTHTMYTPNSVHHRHNVSQSPSQIYWGNGGSQHLAGSNQYITSNRFNTPHHSESTPSVNPTPSFQNTGLSTSPIPKGSHPTLH